MGRTMLQRLLCIVRPTGCRKNVLMRLQLCESREVNLYRVIHICSSAIGNGLCKWTKLANRVGICWGSSSCDGKVKRRSGKHGTYRNQGGHNCKSGLTLCVRINTKDSYT